MRINKKLVVIGLMITALGLTACLKKETNTNVETATESEVAVKDMKKPDSYGKVKLGEYKGIDLYVQDTNVSDEEVEDRISGLLSYNPIREEVKDRAVQDGDTVNIDYVGTIDGVAFDGGTAQNQDLTIGSGTYIPGFEEGLVGADVGETRDVNVKFPENYGNTELSGKSAVFSVTVNSIFIEKDAELTDEWVKEYTYGAQNTVEEFRKSTREELEKSKRISSEFNAQESAIGEVMANSEFELNEKAVDYEYNKWLLNFEEAMSIQGMSFADFASMYGMTEEQLREDLRKNSEEVVKRIIVADAIIEAEKLEITDSDYQTIADYEGTTLDYIRENVDEEVLERAVRNMVAAKFIVENAKTSTLPSYEGLELESGANE